MADHNVHDDTTAEDSHAYDTPVINIDIPQEDNDDVGGCAPTVEESDERDIQETADTGINIPETITGRNDDMNIIENGILALDIGNKEDEIHNSQVSQNGESDWLESEQPPEQDGEVPANHGDNNQESNVALPEVIVDGHEPSQISSSRGPSHSHLLAESQSMLDLQVPVKISARIKVCLPQYHKQLL